MAHPSGQYGSDQSVGADTPAVLDSETRLATGGALTMYAGLWMFAWDLADEGIDTVLGWAADSGLTALQIAGAYHAGWFIHPHNPKHRAYMPEDGCVYFQPSSQLYAGTCLKPKVASVCAQTDWMREAGKRLDQYGLKFVSWT